MRGLNVTREMGLSEEGFGAGEMRAGEGARVGVRAQVLLEEGWPIVCLGTARLGAGKALGTAMGQVGGSLHGRHSGRVEGLRVTIFAKNEDLRCGRLWESSSVDWPVRKQAIVLTCGY